MEILRSSSCQEQFANEREKWILNSTTFVSIINSFIYSYVIKNAPSITWYVRWNTHNDWWYNIYKKTRFEVLSGQSTGKPSGTKVTKNFKHWIRWLRGTCLDLYSGGTRFETWPVYRLSWLSLSLLSSSTEDKFLDSKWLSPQQLSYRSIPNHHPTIWRCTVSILKAPLKTYEGTPVGLTVYCTHFVVLHSVAPSCKY